VNIVDMATIPLSLARIGFLLAGAIGFMVAYMAASSLSAHAQTFAFPQSQAMWPPFPTQASAFAGTQWQTPSWTQPSLPCGDAWQTGICPIRPHSFFQQHTFVQPKHHKIDRPIHPPIVTPPKKPIVKPVKPPVVKPTPPPVVKPPPPPAPKADRCKQKSKKGVTRVACVFTHQPSQETAIQAARPDDICRTKARHDIARTVCMRTF
jgi:outer membrane biosynthesis protein TonB